MPASLFILFFLCVLSFYRFGKKDRMSVSSADGTQPNKAIVLRASTDARKIRVRLGKNARLAIDFRPFAGSL